MYLLWTCDIKTLSGNNRFSYAAAFGKYVISFEFFTTEKALKKYINNMTWHNVDCKCTWKYSVSSKTWVLCCREYHKNISHGWLWCMYWYHIDINQISLLGNVEHGAVPCHPCHFTTTALTTQIKCRGVRKYNNEAQFYYLIFILKTSKWGELNFPKNMYINLLFLATNIF